MIDLEWAHALAAIVGVGIGAATSIFGFGWRMGRIEGRMSEKLEKNLAAAEARIEQKVEEGASVFDETLKGLRQKINDVELDTEKYFLRKGEFDDFRKEYREDIRDIKAMIRGPH